MKRIFFACLLIFALVSCNRDRKRETITNYINIIWKIRSAEELHLSKLEEIKTITGKDSIDMLIKEYSKGTNQTPTLDTILANIKKDMTYDSNLLAKTNRKIDSLNIARKSIGDNTFFSEYIKSFVELRDFTTTQLEELRYEKYLLSRYRKNETGVLSHQVLCEYKIKGHSADTTSKVVTQTFFLSPDERKIYLVK